MVQSDCFLQAIQELQFSTFLKTNVVMLKLGDKKKNTGSLSTDVLGLIQDDTFIFDLEPLHSIFLCHSVLDTNTSLAPSTTTNTVARPLQDDVEVHTINTSRRIIPGLGQNEHKIGYTLDKQSII